MGRLEYEILYLASKRLPVDWAIDLTMENGKVSLFLYNPGGERIYPKDTDMTLEEQIRDAVYFAIEEAGK